MRPDAASFKFAGRCIQPGCLRMFRSPKSPTMKLTIERASLLKSLGHVHRVVERRNTIPILSNVLLRIM